MSTVKANDLQNNSGGIPTVKGQKLIPTAWVNFNGTGTVAIRDSENVSSITDNGTGNYIINFATAMANADYSVVDGFTGSTGNVFSGHSSIAHITTSFRLESRRTDTWNPVDASVAQAAVFGGQ